MNVPLCVDREYGLCYGLSGCPVLKSYSLAHSRVLFFASYYSSLNQFEILEDLDTLHGVHELCDLKPGCHNIVVGAGRNNTDGLYEVCGATYKSPSMGKVCMAKNEYNNTVCANATITQPSCSEGDSNFLVKISETGTGWGAISYEIYEESKEKDKRGPFIAAGSLASGMYEVESICLKRNTCYTYEISNGRNFEYVMWVMCG